jgi:hypothetical protein
MWDLWWAEWHSGRFSPSTSVVPANHHTTDCSTHFNYYPGLEQQAKYWPTYQVDLVPYHPQGKRRNTNLMFGDGNILYFGLITIFIYASTYQIKEGKRDREK